MGKEDDGRLLIVIPAYNEEASIGGVLCELRRECPQADVLVVNDGSADGTLRVCREAGCPVLDLPFNLGLSGGVSGRPALCRAERVFLCPAV